MVNGGPSGAAKGGFDSGRNAVSNKSVTVSQSQGLGGPWEAQPPGPKPTINHYTPPKINMSPEKGPFQFEITSSNHQFSGDMLVFRGVVDLVAFSSTSSNR